jgi:multicomponent Na+:H+ antiporter subunit D
MNDPLSGMPMGSLLVLSLVIPICGVLLSFVAGGRHGERIAFALAPLGLAVTGAIFVLSTQASGPLVYRLGGWAPPLGLALRADGLSAVMMAMTAVVVCAVAVFARADFGGAAGGGRASFAFWILLLAVWGSLNLVFVGGDLFTLYVGLELLTFAAVPLVCLDGRTETLQAALRYLLFALLGSLLYLVGAGLLYGAYGTLDIVLLARRTDGSATALVAAALMTVGLLAKTALFPLHVWLPPAHAGAPAAASAVLSALVVKGSFFILVRLWFDVMPGSAGEGAMQLLAALGAAAILFGSVVALRQERLKLLIAYSTVAQIGALFLMFPLALDAESARLERGGALAGGLLQAMSHATAKAAMFMAAGSIYAALGHDRIGGLSGAARALPLSVLAFALSGLALIGTPFSGAALAKELQLLAAGETQQWWWSLVIHASGILTSSYVVLVLAYAFAPANEPLVIRTAAARPRDVAVLALALCSLVLGIVPWDAHLPGSALTDKSALDGLGKVLWSVLAGGLLALLLGRHWSRTFGHRLFGTLVVGTVDLARGMTFALGRPVMRLDATLRQWSAAGLSLLMLAILFATAMIAPR